MKDKKYHIVVTVRNILPHCCNGEKSNRKMKNKKYHIVVTVRNLIEK
jgi:hypothetical protein